MGDLSMSTCRGLAKRGRTIRIMYAMSSKVVLPVRSQRIVRCRVVHQRPAPSHEKTAPPTRSPVVTISYKQLQSLSTDLAPLIAEAYGPDGLGVLTVSDVPGYIDLRQQLLPLAAKFAELPQQVQALYEDKRSFYSVGWSHGKEKMKNGQADVYKGSFYANPLFDNPQAPSKELAAQFPAYYSENLWPRTHLPTLELAMKLSGQLIIDVGVLLSEHCDRYVASHLPQFQAGSLSAVLRQSTCPKARLLHYFPVPASQQSQWEASPDAWCGWHCDHGSLTGLMAAMYIRPGVGEVPNPDPTCGLYVRDRHGDVVRIPIPADHIAFQVGEAMQVASGGLLRATPHCVRAPKGPAAVGVSRNTLAVFMQPNVDQVMEAPAGVPWEQVAMDSWHPGMTFGEFANIAFQRYYGQT